MKKTFSLIMTLRPKQWYKNLLIFAGITFSFNLTDFSLYPKVILAFAFFCALSGSVYTINDIVDREKDRKHPLKCKRPIASGQLKVSHAIFLAVSLIAFSLGGSFYLDRFFGLAALAYFILNMLYTLKLKNYILVDVLLISIFFVLRAIAGVVVINVEISPWLVVCAFLLALFLALGKRRHEVILKGNGGKETRANLEE